MKTKSQQRFVDMRKAFDMLYHTVLLKKLETWIRKWLKQVLSMLFIIATTESSKCNCHSWQKAIIPHGLGLGPILFSIFVNDLPEYIPFSDILLYVDDTVLFDVGEPLPTLQHNVIADLTALSKWFLHNKLTINIE